MEKLDRKKREHLARRREILLSAEKLFAAKGFFPTTMSEIAREAEFGTGTLYKYFKSKEDLYFTLINEKTEEINCLVKTELSRDLPVRERIERVLRLQFDFIERNRDFFRIYISERSRFEWTIQDDLGKRIHEKMLAYIRLLAQVMKQGIKEGTLKPMNPVDLAHALVGIVNSFVFEWFMTPHPYPLVSKTDTVLNIFFGGVQKKEKKKGGDRSMKMKGAIIGFILFAIVAGRTAWAQSLQAPLTLEESIKIALERNLRLHSATEEITGSKFRQKQAMTNFLPQWTGQYGYTRYSYPAFIGNLGGGIGRITGSPDVYNFNTTVSEPLFTGGLNLANYRLEKLGVDISKTDVETVKRDIVVQVREGYFNILRTDKFVEVAKQAVKQFEAQLEVSKAFFEVGIIPKNDLLQSEVRLANARQGLVRAENDLALAKSSFNILLRRDIDEPLNVVDILEYKPSVLRLEDSIDEALRQRPEIRSAGLRVDQAKEGVKIAKSGLFPTVSLAGNYNRSSDEYDLHGNLRSERWTLQALATLTLFDWGRTAYKVGESKVKVTQAEDSKIQLMEGIVLEVKQGYLNLLTAEKNISVAQKAIEQAEENLRMNEERYKYQVATATDVLDAVTLLAQARVNYYSALSDFNIAKARLDRAMGRMYP